MQSLEISMREKIGYRDTDDSNWIGMMVKVSNPIYS